MLPLIRPLSCPHPLTMIAFCSLSDLVGARPRRKTHQGGERRQTGQWGTGLGLRDAWTKILQAMRPARYICQVRNDQDHLERDKTEWAKR